MRVLHSWSVQLWTFIITWQLWLYLLGPFWGCICATCGPWATVWMLSFCQTSLHWSHVHPVLHLFKIFRIHKNKRRILRVLEQYWPVDQRWPLCFHFLPPVSALTEASFIYTVINQQLTNAAVYCSHPGSLNECSMNNSSEGSFYPRVQPPRDNFLLDSA